MIRFWPLSLSLVSLGALLLPSFWFAQPARWLGDSRTIVLHDRVSELRHSDVFWHTWRMLTRQPERLNRDIVHGMFLGTGLPGWWVPGMPPAAPFVVELPSGRFVLVLGADSSTGTVYAITDDEKAVLLVKPEVRGAYVW